MEEETRQEEPEQEEETNTNDLIEKATAAAERLEKANKELDGLLTKQQEMEIKERLAGKTEAGTQTKTKEQKETEAAKSLLKGTGYEDELFPE